MKGAKCWLDICQCGAGLAVTERVYDMKQVQPQLIPNFLPYRIHSVGIFTLEIYYNTIIYYGLIMRQNYMP